MFFFCKIQAIALATLFNSTLLTLPFHGSTGMPMKQRKITLKERLSSLHGGKNEDITIIKELEQVDSILGGQKIRCGT
jgi:hypothetical protein